jgi:hypothetical protein
MKPQASKYAGQIHVSGTAVKTFSLIQSQNEYLNLQIRIICLLLKCILWCSDFNNLIRATHLLLPNLILRHVYKERFFFILSQSVRI